MNGKRCIVILISSLLIYSCKVIYHNVPEGQLTIRGDGFTYGGTSKIDITPHIGMAMAGYGPDLGKISRGHLGRLFVHSTYIQDADGNFIFLITSDLWGFPRGMGDDITKQLKKRKNLIIPLNTQSFNPARETLLFTATHTHNAHANYSSSFVYNDFNAKVAGFNKKQYIFIRDAIVKSIEESYSNRQRASFYFAQKETPGLSRNRSLGAWLANSTNLKQRFRDRIIDGSIYKHPDPTCLQDEDDQYVAVNPNLSCIVVKSDIDDSLISVIGHYALHPTALGAQSLFSSADVFGVSAAMISSYFQTLTNPPQSPAVSWMNGAEGDISANYHQQGWSETMRLGQMLAGNMIDLINDDLVSIPGTITTRFDVIDIDDKHVIDTARLDLVTGGEKILHTAKVPYIGAFAKRGSEDGRFNPENLEPIDECAIHGNGEAQRSSTISNRQGRKKGNIASPLLENAAPNAFPMGIYDIGSLRLIIMPGEATTGLGERIEMAAYNGNSSLLYIGLANEYTSYITTPSEYDEQHYEGMSTLYGHATGAYLEDQIRNLNKEENANVNHHIGRFAYRPIGLSGYKEKKVIKEMKKDDLSTSDFKSSIGLSSDQHVITVSWLEKVKLSINDVPQVSILQVTSEGDVEFYVDYDINSNYRIKQFQSDSNSFRVLTYAIGGGSRPLNWESMWIVPPDVEPTREYKMKITLNERSFTSSPFSIN